MAQQQAKRIEEGKPAYSGRLLLRMPPELHAEVARKAELERTSLNQFITAAVADAVDGNGAGTNGAHPQSALASPRAITAALVVNFVVLTVAALTAVILLVLIWRGSV